MTDCLIRQTTKKGGAVVRGPQVPWLSRRTHRSQQRLPHTHGYDVLQPKDTKWNQQRVKASGVKPEETRHKLRGSSPSGVPQDVPNLPSNELWQHGWHGIHQGSSLETQCPAFFTEDCQVRILCLTCTKSPDSQKERSVQCKLYCLYKWGRHRQPLFWALGRVRSLLKSKFSDTNQGLPMDSSQAR